MNISKFVFTFCALTSMCLTPNLAIGEDEPLPTERYPINLWVAPGLGVDTFGEGHPFTHIFMEVGGRSGKHIVIAKLQATGDPSFVLYGKPPRRVTEERNTNDKSLLYGRSLLSSEGFSNSEILLLAGVSSVTVYQTKAGTKSTFGLASALSATWTPVRKIPILGFGLDLYGNVNPERSWVALGAKIQVGWLY